MLVYVMRFLLSNQHQLDMSFKPRNSFYLRISATTVLQLLLYLDARHVDFMTADILERVLSALKPRIVQKLGAELSNTKNKKRKEADSEKVDVFRGGRRFTANSGRSRMTDVSSSQRAGRWYLSLGIICKGIVTLLAPFCRPTFSERQPINTLSC